MQKRSLHRTLTSISAFLLIICLLATLALPALAEQPGLLSEASAEDAAVELPEQSELLAATAAKATASGLPELWIRLADGLQLRTVNSGSKDTKYPGNTVTLVNADGSSSEYTNVELKGRGNYTWIQPRMDKKPYQIKFDSKTKIFGMDKAKKWILLANHADGTLMRNKLAFDLAKAMDMPYIDGTKIEANANRYTWVWKKSCLKSRDKVYAKISELIERINSEVLFYHGVKFEARKEYAIEYVELLLTRYCELM